MRNHVRRLVARSAEAQPEETDPAKASSDNLKLHGQNPSIITRLNLTHFVLFLPMWTVPPLLQLDVLRSLTQIQIVNTWTTSVICEQTFWTMAHSIVVTKNSVYTSQALSIASSTVGDWKSINDPVNIHSHTTHPRNIWPGCCCCAEAQVSCRLHLFQQAIRHAALPCVPMVSRTWHQWPINWANADFVEME